MPVPQGSWSRTGQARGRPMSTSRGGPKQPNQPACVDEGRTLVMAARPLVVRSRTRVVVRDIKNVRKKGRFILSGVVEMVVEKNAV